MTVKQEDRLSCTVCRSMSLRYVHPSVHPPVYCTQCRIVSTCGNAASGVRTVSSYRLALQVSVTSHTRDVFQKRILEMTILLIPPP